MTLVSAPAGSGKTTLLAQWVEAWDRPFAWLTVDQNRSELVPFVLDLLSALTTLHPDIGRSTLRILRGARAPAPAKLAHGLCEELYALPEPAGLVLDDFEGLHDPASLEFTSTFIRGCPLSLHTVIASRTDPRIPLTRLRVAGEVSELRASDLYFTPMEARAFLHSLSSRPLAPQVVEAIVNRNEGWPAGLRLAALSMSGGPSTDPERLPTGRSQVVMDYFLEEVLAQTGPEIIRLLLRSSVLEEMCSPLVAAVADVPLSAANRYLGYLERNNLFITAVDGKDGWFRLHRLLREVLVHRLVEAEQPGSVAILHRRASAWFHADGQTDPAIRHALAAGDLEHACEMAEAAALLALDNEDMLLAEQTLRLIPKETVRQRPILLAVQARIVGGRSGWPIGFQLLDAASAQLDREDSSGIADQALIARGLIDTIRTPVQFFGGDIPGSLERAESAYCALRGRLAFGAGWGGFFIGISHYLLGRPQAGMKVLEKLLTDTDASGRSPLAFYALLGMAITHLLAGRLSQSERAAGQMLALETSIGRAYGIAWARYLLGALAYETNRLHEAVQNFDMAIALHQETSALSLNDSLLGAALARQALGRGDEARAVLDEAEQLILTTESIGFLANLHSMRARIALMHGDVGSAQAWNRTIPLRLSPGPLIFMEVPPLTAARVFLTEPGEQAMGESSALASEIEKRCRKEHNVRHLVAVLALQALASAKLGRQGAALKKLESSLDLAQHGGFVRTYIDLGPPMASLLQSLAGRTAHTAYVDRLLMGFASEASGTFQTEAMHIEPLTPRELEILPMLQHRYSNKEIAQELGISVLTVKRHTGSLYAKLQAKGRRDAVRRATSLGMLPQGD